MTNVFFSRYSNRNTRVQVETDQGLIEATANEAGQRILREFIPVPSAPAAQKLLELGIAYPAGFNNDMTIGQVPMYRLTRKGKDMMFEQIGSTITRGPVAKAA